MRRPLVIYDFAPDLSEYPYIEENFILFFISVVYMGGGGANKIQKTGATMDVCRIEMHWSGINSIRHATLCAC